MTEERVIREIRIDEAAGRGDSDSRMTCFEVIMPLKLQSTKILIYNVWDRIKSLLHYTISIRTVIRNDKIVIYQLKRKCHIKTNIFIAAPFIISRYIVMCLTLLNNVQLNWVNRWYTSHIVRSIVLSRLVIRENEWRVYTKEKWRVGV